MSDLTIPRETAEFIPVPVYQDDTLLTEGFEVTLTRWPARPSAWAPPTVSDGKAGIAVAGLEPGTYQVWVRVVGTVIEVGTVEVT